MKREIYDCTYSVTPVAVAAAADDLPVSWLVELASCHDLTTLLVHAEDGVIWGRVEDGRLVVAEDLFDDVPQLRGVTVQQLRLFGAEVELLLWHNGEGAWQARLIKDGGVGHAGWRFDEAQLQWGTDAEAEAGGFTLVADGQQGMRHAVPLRTADIPFDPPQRSRDRWHPLRLGVRHYLKKDEADGRLIITHSRLTGLWAEEWKGGNRG